MIFLSVGRGNYDLALRRQCMVTMIFLSVGRGNYDLALRRLRRTALSRRPWRSRRCSTVTRWGSSTGSSSSSSCTSSTNQHRRSAFSLSFRSPSVFLSFSKNYFFVFFGGLECVGHSFAYAAHFVFLRDVWIRTQRTAVASRFSTNLVTHLQKFLLLSNLVDVHFHCCVSFLPLSII